MASNNSEIFRYVRGLNQVKWAKAMSCREHIEPKPTTVILEVQFRNVIFLLLHVLSLFPKVYMATPQSVI